MTTPDQPTSTPGEGTARPTPAAMANRAPKPGPRPGATPGARPSSADQQQTTPSPVPKQPAGTGAVASDPSKFGRIDETGTVYLTRGGEERQILSLIHI